MATGGQSGSPTANAASFGSSSLYVGDLDPNVSEAQLYELFSQLGPVVSIRVCRDLITRRSLGYAYVNYNSAQDAARSLEILNFTPINNKPIRIMFSHRDPSLRKSGAGNIFIKNLDKSIDHKALHDTFGAFGAILSCKVAVDVNGQSKGYGFVQFETEESAQQAIEKVNGMLLNDKQVYVGPFQRRAERDGAGGSGSKFTNIYVKNLADTVTDEILRETFAQYGTVTSAVVMKDHEGVSKGFGFVNFEEPDCAAKAVAELDGHDYDGKAWYVGRAQKKSEREQELRNRYNQERQERMDKLQGANLYIKNLDDSVDDEKLRELFAELGTITSCKVMRDGQGRSRGSGFVSFSNTEEATRAVTEMNGKIVAQKPLYVALAQRKEERQQRLQAQFAQRAFAVGGPVPAGMPMYPPPGMAQQMFFGQPPPGLIPPQGQPQAFGYQQQMMPANVRPGQQMPNYFVPMVQRQSNQGQRMGVRRGGGQQPSGPGQQPGMGRGQATGRGNARFPQARPDGMMMPEGMPPGLIPADGMSQPVIVQAPVLANATPEQQRMMLGEALYPLVEALQPSHAGKVTGMLLEMDQSEVLHLIESPEALRAKVAEAMSVLQAAQGAGPTAPLEQMAALSLGEGAAGSS
eukprot:jgi/Chlat1/8446/Chrsp80S00648